MNVSDIVGYRSEELSDQAAKLLMGATILGDSGRFGVSAWLLPATREGSVLLCVTCEINWPSAGSVLLEPGSFGYVSGHDGELAHILVRDLYIPLHAALEQIDGKKRSFEKRGLERRDPLLAPKAPTPSVEAASNARPKAPKAQSLLGRLKSLVSRPTSVVNR